jgi:PilZ domain
VGGFKKLGSERGFESSKTLKIFDKVGDGWAYARLAAAAYARARFSMVEKAIVLGRGGWLGGEGRGWRRMRLVAAAGGETDMDKPEAGCSVQVTWADRSGDVHAQEAIVLSLEERKIKLALREVLLPSQRCTIALTGPDGRQTDSVQATVHHFWRREQRVHVTCELAGPLSEASLKQLVLSRQHERRVAERQPVTIDACVREELGSESLSIRVVDVSEGGCCLESPREVSVGQKVRLMSWDERGRVASVFLRVKWQRRSGEAFLVGCQFVSEGQHAALLGLVGGKEAASPTVAARQSMLKRACYLAEAGAGLVKAK